MNTVLKKYKNNMELAILQYTDYLNEKYKNTLENKWFWIIVAMVTLAAIGLYAWYCTSRGYAFAFNIKYNWPKSGQMGIACK
ncbi:hypothetical protein A9Q68_09630 [Streptococcus bovimastitidis]|uniref:Uncharacterized protein n=1 Tax=Streptococcus bovimastitidis TaxID=1856638 RepID=A0A1L8ML38_9STRE|nr:hypothetical protein [Streptococcus bovimastitidis]OJF71431.1 hypothetical protein A9Q68_09630 [Streptococcus bovimastitidis]